MQTMKSLSLFLLLAAPHACAMNMQEIIISSTIDDVRNIVHKEKPVEEARLLLEVASSHGKKPLYTHTAILAGEIKALDIFLKAGAPKEQDAKKRTPLHCALDKDNTEAITVLFQYPEMREYDLTSKVKSKEMLRHYCQEVEKVSPREQNPSTWIAMTTAITPPYIEDKHGKLPPFSIPSHMREITQEFIDKGYVYIPMFSEKDSAKYDAPYINSLRMLLGAKEVSLPEDLRLKAQQCVISHHIRFGTISELVYIKQEFNDQANNPLISPLLKQIQYKMADHYAEQYLEAKSNMSNTYYRSCKNCILLSLTPDVQEHFNQNNLLTWHLYRKALLNNDRDVINKIKQITSIADNQTTEWNNALAMCGELNAAPHVTDEMRLCAAKITAIADLDPAFFRRSMNRKTANLIHDFGIQGGFDDLASRVYDYVSDDRIPLRQCNPFYQYRKCRDPHLATYIAYLDQDDAPAASASTNPNTSNNVNATDEKKDQ